MDFLAKKEEYVVITGAGVSMNSGLPSGPELCLKVINSIASELDFDSEELKYLARNIPLETTFQVLSDFGLEEIINKLISEIDSDNLSSSHIAISDFVNQSKIKKIITFNFDRLHEKSLNRWSLINTQSFGKSLVKKFKNENNSVEIYKLHGCSEKSGIINFSEYIRGFQFSLKDRLFKILNNQNLLFLGYGGWDYDFSQLLNEFLQKGLKLNKIIWIDRHFPKTGGRTDLIKKFKLYGYKVYSIEADINELFSNYKSKRDFIPNKNYFKETNKELKKLPKNIRLNIIFELSLLTDKINIPKRFIENISQHDVLDSLSFAIILERIGRDKEAIKYFQLTAKKTTDYKKKMLAAIKLYIKTKCEVNILPQLKELELPKFISPFFNLIEYGLKTDIGGLNREYAKSLCESLPPIEKLKSIINDRHLIRLLIHIYTEIARLLYESNNFEEAFINDECALELAQILSDPELLMLTQGNLGISYMGLADIEKDNKYLDHAKSYLEMSIGYSSSLNAFRHALFQANLGLVYYLIGPFHDSIPLVEKALNKLVEVYPNYSIHFFGKLASIYTDLYVSSKNEEDYKKSKKLITTGFLKTKELNDFDDLWAIEEALKKLKKTKKHDKELFRLEQKIQPLIR